MSLKITRKNPFKLGTDLFDPSNRFETSWLISPWLLAGCRALFSLYIFFTRFFVIGWSCTHSTTGCTDARRSFSYLTILTYWGLGFYFLVSAIHGFTYALRGAPLLDRLPRPLQALHSLFYSTVVSYPFLVTIVYWGVLFPSDGYESTFYLWSDISQHGLNSFFALFEIIVPRTKPPPAIHALWLVAIMACYLGLAFITLATQGFYVYKFLDHDRVGGRGVVAGYILGIAVATVIIFGVVWGFIWLRRWVTETKLGKDGEFAEQPSWRANDVEMNSLGTKSARDTPDRMYN